MSKRDNMSFKTSTDPDLLSKIPTNTFAIQGNLNYKENNISANTKYDNDTITIYQYEFSS